MGTDSNGADGWRQTFGYPNGPGSYAFYSAATDDDGNTEDVPVRADAYCLFNHPEKQASF
jgi:hypothetical protein